MKTRNLLIGGIVFAVCFVFIWSVTSIEGSNDTYEIEPEITLPEYRSDTARAIDAYERMMNRYIDLMRDQMNKFNVEVRDVSKKLDNIDKKLTELCIRVERIEEALGIEELEETGKDTAENKTLDHEAN